MNENKTLPRFRRGDFVPRQWVGKPMNDVRWATILANLRRLL